MLALLGVTMGLLALPPQASIIAVAAIKSGSVRFRIGFPSLYWRVAG
jgi:hypothetical protein